MTTLKLRGLWNPSELLRCLSRLNQVLPLGVSQPPFLRGALQNSLVVYQPPFGESQPLSKPGALRNSLVVSQPPGWGSQPPYLRHLELKTLVLQGLNFLTTQPFPSASDSLP